MKYKISVLTKKDGQNHRETIDLRDKEETTKLYEFLSKEQKSYVDSRSLEDIKAYKKSQEPTPLTLQETKQQKLQELAIWDKSLEVNGMSFGNSTIWLKQGNRLS